MTIMERKPEARPGSLDTANDASVTWLYLAPAGTTLEMCQRPDYWRNVAKECGQQRVPGRHAWNKIEIIAEDGSWEALLRVLSVSDGFVHTRLLSHVREAAKPGRRPNLPEGYVVEMVAGNGWRAIDPDGQMVAQRLTTEDEATRAASAHLKKKGD